MKSLLVIFLLSTLAVSAQAQSSVKYYCQPCNSACDTIAYLKPGQCQHCDMPLVARNNTEIKAAKVALNSRLNVAIFLYEGVELLDFAGPGEVFSSAGFNVYTVAATDEALTSQGFVSIKPKYSIVNCPKPDIIVLPGGASNGPMQYKAVIDWLKRAVPQTVQTMSVCTGAGLLSKAVLLDGKTVTTFHNYIDELQRITPKAKVLRDRRYIDNGSIITTAGVSAGIDGALHVVYKLKGKSAAEQTAAYMEYDKWKPEEGMIVSK